MAPPIAPPHAPSTRAFLAGAALAAVVLLAPCAGAQQRYTRAQVVAAALTSQPLIALAGADSASAAANVSTARAYPNPTFSFQYTKDIPRHHSILDIPARLPVGAQFTHRRGDGRPASGLVAPGVGARLGRVRGRNQLRAGVGARRARPVRQARCARMPIACCTWRAAASRRATPASWMCTWPRSTPGSWRTPRRMIRSPPSWRCSTCNA